MDHMDLPDSTDWLDTPLSLLAPLESSLRCQVCKDFFDNPVITSCSHTFCSLCIRRCLSTEGKCPACRSSDQELKLRRNWAVQELVETFGTARPQVLGVAREAKMRKGVMEGEEGDEPPPKKRKVASEEVEGLSREGQGRRTRSQSKRTDYVPTPTPDVVEDIQDDNYVPDDGLVPCPVCNRRMKNEAVFSHLDVCTGTPGPSKPASFGSLQPMAQMRKKPEDPARPPERLPAINYNLLKDGMLRKKLRELGIPDWGSKAQLTERHKEWMNLWNANCDSKVPKSKRELLQELDIWERTQGGSSSLFAGSASTVMRKDFDADAWSTNYDNDFKRLIANARKKNDDMVRSTIPQAAEDVPNEPTAPLPQPPEMPAAPVEVSTNHVPVHGLVNGVDEAQPSQLSQDQEVNHIRAIDAPPG